jgi:CHASE2 domain-containing sensor protein
MDENRKLLVVVFGAFAAFGVMAAVIAGAVATQVDGDVRSVFRMVALIAIVLACLTAYVALAASRKWWPLRDSQV